jgi:hypothetical protein
MSLILLLRAAAENPLLVTIELSVLVLMVDAAGTRLVAHSLVNRFDSLAVGRVSLLGMDVVALAITS